MSDQTPADQPLSLTAVLESLLFVASGPTAVSRLAKTLEITPNATRKLLDALQTDYQQRGLRLQWTDGDSSVQLTTAPEVSESIERFLGLEAPISRLSQAALEVLSIIAYLQPITRPQVDELRGVNSDGALRTLLSKGLLEEVGRKEGPGRPILYGTTPEFMQHFGLGSLAELPQLEQPQDDEVTLFTEDGNVDLQPVARSENGNAAAQEADADLSEAYDPSD